jgi:hypothetical protein
MLTTLTYRQELEWVEPQLLYLISLYDMYRQNVTLTSYGPIFHKLTYIIWYYISRKQDTYFTHIQIQPIVIVFPTILKLLFNPKRLWQITGFRKIEKIPRGG